MPFVAVFVIEHLDPQVWQWSVLEYKHISRIVGRKNLWFTNFNKDGNKLKKFGKVFEKNASQLNLKRVCILDSTGKETLQPEDAKNFDYFVFGGVLGDFPEAGVSLKMIKSMPNAEVRNLGLIQMSTDTAVMVTKKILKGKKLEELKFMDSIRVPIREGEEIELPYRYLEKDGKPIITPGLIRMLKKQEGF